MSWVYPWLLLAWESSSSLRASRSLSSLSLSPPSPENNLVIWLSQFMNNEQHNRKSIVPVMYVASLVMLCLPLPPTPNRRALPWGCRSTRAMRATCSCWERENMLIINFPFIWHTVKCIPMHHWTWQVAWAAWTPYYGLIDILPQRFSNSPYCRFPHRCERHPLCIP